MCVLRGRCMWDSRRCCLNVCVCVFVYDHLMKITKAHCHCNLLCITTTISELFGDNSEGAGTAHFSSTCHISAAASALLLLTYTHTRKHTQKLAYGPVRVVQQHHGGVTAACII